MRSPGSSGMSLGGLSSLAGFGRRGRDAWGERERDYMGMMAGMGGMGMGREVGRKEELVDVTYTEKLKKFIGDPFAEHVTQKTVAPQPPTSPPAGQ